METKSLPDTTSTEYNAVLTPALIQQFFSLQEHDFQALLPADPKYLRDNLSTYLPSLSKKAFDAVSSVLTLPDPKTVLGMFWVSRVAYQDLSSMSESDLNYYATVSEGFRHRFSDSGIKAKLKLVETTSQPNTMLAILKAIRAHRDLLFNEETAKIFNPQPTTEALKKQIQPTLPPVNPAPDQLLTDLGIKSGDPDDLSQVSTDEEVTQQTATTIPTAAELPLGYAVLAPLRDIMRKLTDKDQALAELGKDKLAQSVMELLDLESVEALYTKLKDHTFSIEDLTVLAEESWENQESNDNLEKDKKNNLEDKKNNENLEQNHEKKEPANDTAKGKVSRVVTCEYY